jgi:uncharacterized membrane protein YeaQ/YmgE (transglycosylase-associated protein family)
MAARLLVIAHTLGGSSRAPVVVAPVELFNLSRWTKCHRRQVCVPARGFRAGGQSRFLCRVAKTLGHWNEGDCAGFIASKIVNKSGQGIVMDIVLGVVGAIVGGYLFTLVGQAPVDGFNLYSMFVAVIGAIIVLLVYHAITRRTRSL